jgi:hypothetical protein
VPLSIASWRRICTTTPDKEESVTTELVGMLNCVVHRMVSQHTQGAAVWKVNESYVPPRQCCRLYCLCRVRCILATSLLLLHRLHSCTLTRWNGAAARSVASTASRFTLSPLGIMGLMYLQPRMHNISSVSTNAVGWQANASDAAPCLL